MSEISIRPMSEADTKAVAAVHIQSFPGFFLTFLGQRFLNELYRAIVQDDLGMAFVAKEQGKIVGFVAGATCLSGLYRHLLYKRVWRFAWASTGGLLRKPTILPRLLRAFRMTSQKDPAPNCGSLMSIAVLPEMQGRGVGRRLVQKFLTEAHQRGLENLLLSTDRDHNASANRFYQSLGFSLLREHVTPEGRWMNDYIIPLGVPEMAGASRREAYSHNSPTIPRRSNESVPG